jgi:hypothetical protein
VIAKFQSLGRRPCSETLEEGLLLWCTLYLPGDIFDGLLS